MRTESGVPPLSCPTCGEPEEEITLVMARNWPVVRRENEVTAVQATLVDKPGTCGVVVASSSSAMRGIIRSSVSRCPPAGSAVASTGYTSRATSRGGVGEGALIL